MARVVVMSADEVTAPTLLALNTRGARAVAVAFLAATSLSVIGGAGPGEDRSLGLLLAALGVGAIGLGAIVVLTRDPMPLSTAVAVAATGPVACILTCLGLPQPVVNANQTNALGIGLVVCSFVCVRGRTGVAWVALALMIATFAVWSSLIGRGAVAGLILAGPNVAILGMATLLAAVMRPAAAEIRRLRVMSIDQAEASAAADSRDAEGTRQRRELRELASPWLVDIAAGRRWSEQEVREMQLMEARLRDGVRARSLKIPALVDAIWAARLRNVRVVVFDDGDAEHVDDERVRDAFCRLACTLLTQAEGGVITLRVHPPGRLVWGSVVIEDPDGDTSRRIDVRVDGAPPSGQTTYGTNDRRRSNDVT